MDRSIFVGANFTNAILNRVVLNSSDLNEANIEGADFSDALLDKATQKKLCESPTATGTNPVTGVSTRTSLKCGRNSYKAKARVRHGPFLHVFNKAIAKRLIETRS